MQMPESILLLTTSGGASQRVFLDVKVFNPLAPSYRSLTRNAAFVKQEKDKKRHYRDRVREVEHGSFTPLVFTVSGGMAKESTVFYKRLATLLSNKWSQPYSVTINWIRCCITFSLLRSSIRCLRGARSSVGKPVGPVQCPIDLIRFEGRFD